MLHSGADTSHEHPRMDWPGYHDTFEYLDNHPLEGERQDVELHLCSLPGACRTLTLWTIIQQR